MNKTQITQKRIGWIDIAKAISILLIVYGHTVRGDSALMNAFSFHIACFFLLSGMTCKADRLKDRIKKDFLTILVPYYCFGILSILIFAVLGKFASAALNTDANTSVFTNLIELVYANPGGNRMKFNMPLWFLPCFFATKMLYYGLDKLFRGKHLFVLIGSVVLCAFGFLYTHFIGFALPFNLAVSLKMLVFFVLGRIFFLHIQTHAQKMPKALWNILIGVGLLSVNTVISFFVPRISYAGDIFPNIATFIVTALCGSLGVCFLSMGIGNCKILEYTGKHTLAILVMHKFPILLFQTVAPFSVWLTQHDTWIGIISNILVALIALILCLVVELFINRFLPFLLGDFSGMTHRKKSKN